MTLSPKDLKLVNEAIDFWKNSVKPRILKGDTVISRIYCKVWKSDGVPFAIKEDYWYFCVKHWSKKPKCAGCYFYKTNICELETIKEKNFLFNPCLETCQAMIAALESLKEE